MAERFGRAQMEGEAGVPVAPPPPTGMTAGADGGAGVPPAPGGEVPGGEFTEAPAGGSLSGLTKDPVTGEVSQGPPQPGRPGAPPPGPTGPPPVPVPQVPPPPVSFQLGGMGGGEGASSFARPGSAAARPFRSSQFLTSRAQGGGPTEGRPGGFGAGAAISGGALPVADFGAGGEGGAGGLSDEDLQRILAQVAGRYGGA